MRLKPFACALTFCFIMIFSVQAQGDLQLDCKMIENVTGHKGDMNLSTGVFKVSVPHKDVKVNTIGILLTPELGLTSWVDFKKTGSDAEISGEMVLIEDQVGEVMKAALDNGLKVKSLYNKYLWDTPKLMYMQVEGKGQINDLAKASGQVFESIKKSRKSSIWGSPLAHINASKTTLDVRNIEILLGTQGIMKSGVYKVVFGNEKETTAPRGELTWAAFVGSDKQALILGDIAMEENEVQDVLKSLIKNDFLILSLHQHMMGENSKIQIVHYMKQGPAVDLAKNIMETLETMKDVQKNTKVTVHELPVSEKLPLEEKTDRIRKLK